MDHCDAAHILREKHIRATARKKALLEEIIGSDSPRCARELYDTLAVSCRLNLVTVYRNLASLRDAGILREITDSSGVQYYEMACRHNPVHPHFHCEKCHALICLPALSGSDSKHIREFADSCDVSEINLVLSGICRRCLEEIE